MAGPLTKVQKISLFQYGKMVAKFYVKSATVQKLLMGSTQ